MRQKSLLTSLFVLAAIAAGGCTTSMVKPIQQDVEAQYRKSAALASQLRSIGATNSPTRSNDVWIPSQYVESKADASLPGVFSRRVTLNQTLSSIYAAAQEVTRRTGVPVDVSPDVSATGSAMGGLPSTAVPGMPVGGMPQVGQPNMAAGMGGNPALGGVNVLSNAPASPVDISFEGPLSKLMDTLASSYGLSWDYSDGKAHFFRYKTKTFTLNAIAGDTSVQSSVSDQGQTSVSGGSGGAASGAGASSSSGGSGTSNGNQTSISAQSLSVWKGIHDSINAMLSPGGKVQVTPALGTVTVTDTPMVLSRVERFIHQQNIALSKQVIVNVEVLSVSLDHQDSYGINWDLVYSAMSKNMGWSFASNFAAAATNASNLTLKILPTAGQATNSDIQSWQGTQALISALSQQGHVSVVTQATAVTLNNQPIPIQVGSQTTYLASASINNTPNVGSQSSMNPGVVNTGFSMSVLPHILDNDRVMLQYGISLSSLLSLDTVTSGGTSIQTPKIDTRNFLQRVGMKSGETLVLAGFEQAQNNVTTQGTGSASATWAGGGIRGTKNRTTFVILVRPVVVSNL